MSHTPGRNDPCPCGSGKKYKQCHALIDREADRSPRLRLLDGTPDPSRRRDLPPAGQLNRVWEVDAVPVPAGLGNDPAARLTAIMVVASPFVLICEMANRLSAEPGDIAERLAQEVLLAVQQSGVTPTRIAICHASLLDPLASLLRPHGIAVSLQADLDGVMHAVLGLLQHVFGGLPSPEMLRSEPETWGGWGLSAERVAQMFDASAAFYRAKPWKHGLGELPIFVSRDGGHEWAAVILGAAGEQSGLSLYRTPSDLDRLSGLDVNAPGALRDAMHGETLAVLFNTRAELPKRMREEIKAAGWEVAAADAYPTLVVLNSVGGGIRAQYFGDLLDVMRTIPRFVASHVHALTTGVIHKDQLRWTDQETGITCRVEVDDEALVLDDDLPSIALSIAGPEGAGARPRAVLYPSAMQETVDGTLSRYGEWLRTAEGKRPPSVATVKKYVRAVQEFVVLAAFGSSISMGAINEYDLRQYLYDWYPRHDATTIKAARAHLKELSKLFEFLEASEQVRCAWAWPILDDFEALDERCRTSPAGDEDDKDTEAWRTTNTIQLAVLMLIPFDMTHMGVAFGEIASGVEMALGREAHRLWLASRDDALRAGLVSPADVLAHIVADQRRWADTPHDDMAGFTPTEAVARIRKEAGTPKRQKSPRSL